MMYYNKCEFCGANLDPGERCDCQEKRIKKEKLLLELFAPQSDGQMMIAEVMHDPGI